ncbi:MAG: hypothetical protein HY721_23245 [Planctomycetes bacterium]|nr:hypothetical protein [Planctomycetota bacterium]
MIEQREAEGLYVAVKDLSRPRDSLQYFDRDLASYGFLPILVMLELDRGSESTFDLRREDILLCLRDGTRLRSVDPEVVSEAVAFTHLRSAFGFVLLVPGFIVASSVDRANGELESDYGSKAVKSVRVNPNMRSFRGVVFFQVPEDLEDAFTMEDAFVELKLNMQGRGGAIGKPLELPVHFGR